MFPSIGHEIFEIVSGELKGKTLEQLALDPYVEEFSVEICSNEFTLENTFLIKIEHHGRKGSSRAKCDPASQSYL